MKDLVRQFINRWRDDRAVQDVSSFRDISAVLRDLGQFYQKNGQRAALSDEVREEVLAKLRAAEATFPPEREKILGLF